MMRINRGKISQKGHAAILFAMMIPVLFGVFTVGTDGARAIQDKARFNEALEVAGLAVAAQNSEDNTKRVVTASAYIKYFFPLAQINDSSISITKITCDEDTNSSVCDYDPTKSRYYQYTITGSLSQESWFPGNEQIVGIGETYKVGSSSVARKYQSQTIDIVYVADFSGSMDTRLNTGSAKKYQILVDIIKEVNADVKAFNDKISFTTNKQSEVAFTAYNQYVHGSLTTINNNHGRRGQGNSSTSTTTPCNLDNWLYLSGQKSDSNVDTSRTASIDHMLNDTALCGSSTVDGTFATINLTDQFGSSSENFEQTINSYRPGGNTSSTQGIIEGARIAIAGSNPRRLMIILSDGDDYPASKKTVTQTLVDQGLCDNIRAELDGQTVDGEKVKSRIAIIGFGFSPSVNPGLVKCVGGADSGNIFEADSSTALKTAILSLISEEIGHLATD
jgi:tight adherence protein G